MTTTQSVAETEPYNCLRLLEMHWLCPGGGYTGCPQRGGQGDQKGKCERCGFDFDQEHLTPASVEAAREIAQAEIARLKEVEKHTLDMSRLVRVQVPDIGEFSNLPIVELFVKVGDSLQTGDAICTIESDKATMDIPSTTTGLVQEVLIKVGDKVSEGMNLITLVVSENAINFVLIGEPVAAPKSVNSAGPDGETKPDLRRYRWLDISKRSRLFLFCFIGIAGFPWLMFVPTVLFGADIFHAIKPMLPNNTFASVCLMFAGSVFLTFIFLIGGLLIAIGKIMKLTAILTIILVALSSIKGNWSVSLFLMAIAGSLVWTIVPRSGCRVSDFLRYLWFINSWDRPTLSADDKCEK